MDKVTAILVEALRQGAEGNETRLYRSGKLPGLFSGRTSLNSEVAAQAMHEGLIELLRTEVRGKTTLEWVRVTPKGIAFLLERESPVQAMEELKAVLQASHEGIPTWLEEMKRSLKELENRFLEEVQSISRRLEALASRVTQALKRTEQAVEIPEGTAGALPWADDLVNHLQKRRNGGLADRCPLSELFAVLRDKDDALTVRDFHSGLRRLHDRGKLRLLRFEGPDGPPEPEYALLDGAAVYYYVAL